MTTLTLQPDATAGKDTTIRGFNPTFNYGITTTLTVGFDPISGGIRRPLLQFDLSGLPSNAVIQSAILTLDVTSEIDPIDTNVNIHRSLVAWFEGSQNGSAPGAGVDGSTWNNKNANGSVSWGAAGGLAGTDYASTPTDTKAITGTGTFSWDVGADVQKFVLGTATNFGWWLLGLESGGTNTIKTIASSDDATAGNRPQLVITYTTTASPLVLQPGESVGQDTFIQSNVPTFNFGISPILTVGIGAGVYRTLIKFDLSVLPVGAVVSSATLTLWCSSESDGSDVPISVRRSLVDWFEGNTTSAAPAAGVDGSTWNNKNTNGSVAWGTAGGLSGTDYDASITDTQTITAAGAFYNWNVTADIQAFIAGTKVNRGWWLIQGSPSSPKSFDSSSSTTLAHRPSLTLVFTTNISGSVAGTSTVTGTLVGKGNIRGSAAGTSDTHAQIITNFFSTGHIAGTSTASGTLTGVGKIRGNSFGDSTAIAMIKASYHSVGHAFGTSAHVARIKGKFHLQGVAAGVGTAIARLSSEGQMRGAAFGTSTATATGYARAKSVAPVIGCNPVPLLHITDGGIRSNGQLNILNFLSDRAGYLLSDWKPQVSQYKDGGSWSSSPQSQGRRLNGKVFDNVIDVFELAAKAGDQDSLIQYQQDLMDFQEAASDYWASENSFLPYYLVARAARETNTRYAIIHMISCPELENPYSQPFFDNNGAVFTSLTVRIEHGLWASTPPGKFDCVPVSGQREWTVSGWQAGS